jgi:hypothetical protein
MEWKAAVICSTVRVDIEGEMMRSGRRRGAGTVREWLGDVWEGVQSLLDALCFG